MLISGPVSFYHMRKDDKNIYLFGDLHHSFNYMKPFIIKLNTFLQQLFKTNNKFDFLNEISYNIIPLKNKDDMMSAVHNFMGSLYYLESEGFYSCKYTNVNYYGCFLRNDNWLLFTKNTMLKEWNDATAELIQLCVDSYDIINFTLLDIINISQIVYKKMVTFFTKYNINNFDDLVVLFMEYYFKKIITDNNLLEIIKKCMDNNSNRLIINNFIIQTREKCYNDMFTTKIINKLLKLSCLLIDADILSKILLSKRNTIVYYGNSHIKKIYNELINNDYICVHKYELNLLRDNKFIRTVDVGNSFDEFFINHKKELDCKERNIINSYVF